MAKKVVRDPRKPDWWYWPRDWISAIKHRTGWTDEELAKQLGISSRTLNYLKKEAYSGRAGMVLRLLSMYQDLTVKGEISKMAKIKNYVGRTGMELSYVRVQTVQAVQVARPRKKKTVDWVRITETFIAGGIWVIVFMMLGAALAVQVL